jgi:hypothetical protein
MRIARNKIKFFIKKFQATTGVQPRTGRHTNILDYDKNKRVFLAGTTPLLIQKRFRWYWTSDSRNSGVWYSWDGPKKKKIYKGLWESRPDLDKTAIDTKILALWNQWVIDEEGVPSIEMDYFQGYLKKEDARGIMHRKRDVIRRLKLFRRIFKEEDDLIKYHKVSLRFVTENFETVAFKELMIRAGGRIWDEGGYTDTCDIFQLFCPALLEAEAHCIQVALVQEDNRIHPYGWNRKTGELCFPNIPWYSFRDFEGKVVRVTDVLYWNHHFYSHLDGDPNYGYFKPYQDTYFSISSPVDRRILEKRRLRHLEGWKYRAWEDKIVLRCTEYYEAFLATFWIIVFAVLSHLLVIGVAGYPFYWIYMHWPAIITFLLKIYTYFSK